MLRKGLCQASMLMVAILLAVARPSVGQCTSGSTVAQWRCWEQTITSSVDFYAGGSGNPYRDVIVRVTFSGGGVPFTQDAFWAADTANPRNFKVRAALPPANWNWAITSCTFKGGSCNATWTPSSGGPIIVTASSSGPQIYTRGFPTQIGIVTGGGTTIYSQIYYGDITTFYWSGDTAWAAPGFEASGQTSRWGTGTTRGTYLYDRSSNGFNVTLIAPAATYAAFPAGRGPFLPDSNSCPNPVPNDCSRPNPTYWSTFDTLISNANQAGIVPLIAGLVDPLDTASSGSYPCQANAVAFSRYLAARMSGFAVFFSPGFDDKPSATTASACTSGPSAQPLTQVMNAVGTALKQAAPLYIVTNHLNGRATCSDYQAFRASSWMTAFLFQSSHGIGLPTASPDPSGTICPRAQDTTETSVQASLRRAWQMPWTLTSSAANPPLPSYNPWLPSYNAEGPYDNICLQTQGCTCPTTNPPAWCISYDPNFAANYGANYVDIRYHNRQAAFDSVFSGGYGFTYGAQEIAHWYFNLVPFGSALSGPSLGDMRSVFQNFNTRAGLTPRRNWITNNGVDTADDGNYKKALASDGSSLVLAYVPGGSSTGPTKEIDISTTSMPTLTCPNATWTYTWRHAQNNALDTTPVRCTGSNPIAITRPDLVPLSTACSGYDSNACDWVLQIQKTGAATAQSAQLAPSAARLDVWADLSPSDGTSAIEASFNGALSVPAVVSPAGLAFQQSPRVTRLRDGYLVVWHADGLDGSLLGVFAQTLDRNAQPIGNRLQLNITTEEDQHNPAVDSDPLGNTVVVWESYGQDGDLGGIFARLLDPSGTPVSGEIPVNVVVAGHQEMPQVSYLPGGSFVVAWQTRPMRSAPGALSFRVFSGTGKPLTAEISIPASPGVTSRLMDLIATPVGTIRVRWGLDNVDGTTLGLWMQDFNSTGLPLGAATPLS